jgi:hypothetical protein
MHWLDPAFDKLTQEPVLGYLPGGAPAAEPTALAALALAAGGRVEAARRSAEGLATMQQPGGQVAIRAGEDSPGWPTSLAIVAWTAVGFARDPIERAVAWLLANRGRPVERSDSFAHNTELVGWAYAEQTHSWVEPTAFAVLALNAAGRADHPSAREAIDVLLDRQLPGGGLNYGNTYVLGQLIRPHVQPTGIALLALRASSNPQALGAERTAPSATAKVTKSIAWLRRSIGPETTPLSLGWAVLGLRAHGVILPQTDEWLASAAAKSSAHKLALLALAAKGWPA